MSLGVLIPTAVVLYLIVGFVAAGCLYRWFYDRLKKYKCGCYICDRHHGKNRRFNDLYPMWDFQKVWKRHHLYRWAAAGMFLFWSLVLVFGFVSAIFLGISYGFWQVIRPIGHALANIGTTIDRIWLGDRTKEESK